MSMLINPTTLRRVYDIEFRVPGDEDALTLPEMLETVSAQVWKELDGRATKQYTAREPMISSFRRNLQSEHVSRLIDLTLPAGRVSGAAGEPIANLAAHHLREIKGNIDATLEKADSKIDPYTLSHLESMQTKIDRALEPEFIYNSDDITAGGGTMTIRFGSQP
jgi:hypothetical protein